MSCLVDGRADIYHEHTIDRSRKAHRCDACKETVPVGGTYTRVFILFDGSKESLKRCPRCQQIHKHLRDLGDFDVWPDERLDCGMEYTEHWGRKPPEDIAALAFSLPGERVEGTQ